MNVFPLTPKMIANQTRGENRRAVFARHPGRDPLLHGRAAEGDRKYNNENYIYGRNGARRCPYGTRRYPRKSKNCVPITTQHYSNVTLHIPDQAEKDIMKANIDRRWIQTLLNYIGTPKESIAYKYANGPFVPGGLLTQQDRLALRYSFNYMAMALNLQPPFPEDLQNIPAQAVAAHVPPPAPVAAPAPPPAPAQAPHPLVAAQPQVQPFQQQHPQDNIHAGFNQLAGVVARALAPGEDEYEEGSLPPMGSLPGSPAPAPPAADPYPYPRVGLRDLDEYIRDEGNEDLQQRVENFLNQP